MDPKLLSVLADPIDGSPLTLDGGRLRGGGNRTYPIIDGIPRFAHVADEGQTQTGESFAFKWTKRDSFGSETMNRELHRWLLERYGFETGAAMRDHLASKGRVLDAGCGAGVAASAWLDDAWRGEWIGLDISEAIDVAQERLGSFPATHFVQGDVSQPPFRRAIFDVVFSEGVLHHTPSTERAFKALVPLLRFGGELMIYIYRRKAPIREFTDDYVRERLADLSPSEAWEQLRSLTKLGQALAELETEVEVPEDVALLGIKAGRYDVQRLVYWNIAKLFWNPDMTFEENNHLNFDWYAPRYAWRHDEDELRRWYAEARLEITRFHSHDAGYTICGVRR